MREKIQIRPAGPVRSAIRPPGSKSITNRALVCAALAEGRSILSGVLDSEDTRVMFDALGQLGVPLALDPMEHVITVRGCRGRLPAKRGELYVANSGTTARFLAAVATLGHGIFRIDGSPRMQERPIQDLIDALCQLGADICSAMDTGCPPLLIRANGLRGGKATIRGDVSSQFLSALLMVAPYAQHGIELAIEGELVSKPYVEMTLAVMSAFGVDVRVERQSRFVVPIDKPYQGREYAIEPDASAASYFFGAAAITGSEIRVEGLSRKSLQGDVAFIDILAQMGCEVREDEQGITLAGRKLHGVRANMNAISDTVPTLAVVALFADGPTTITGVGHIRHKETDRIAAVATELRKLGATVEEHADGLTITPGALGSAQIATYDDHRMAMSFALAGLRVPGIVILNPGCTAKTYPRFFEDLAAAMRQHDLSR